MNPHRTQASTAATFIRPKAKRWSRALGATTSLALLAGGLAACGTGGTRASVEPTSAREGSTLVTLTIPTVVTTVPNQPTTVVTGARTECRADTAPNGKDSYGVIHTGEKICTWGPELRSRLDSQGFVIPSQNHPVDLPMAERCWSASGRVYLRTPASNGWACIGGAPAPATPAVETTLSASSRPSASEDWDRYWSG